MAPTLIQVTNPWKGKSPENPLENNRKGGTPEVHFGIRALMMEILVTLSWLQLEFHQTIEQLQLQEALLNQDYLSEANLTN